MTIVAGFRSDQGLVLCADTQETVSNLSKRHVPKLIFEPTGRLGTTQALHTDDLAAAFCGAGDGPFLDMLVREAWEAAQRGTNLENACARATKAIKQTYREYGEIYQPGSCPIVDLVFGLKMHGNSKLFIANGPVITEKTEYISAGAGFYLADFLSDRMYKPYLPLNACVILAAYVLFQAKEHVDGCGGQSHIAVLRNEGVSGRVDSRRIELVTKLLQSADREIGGILLDAADFSHDDKQFRKLGTASIDLFSALRNATMKEIEAARNSWIAVGKILGGSDYKEEPLDEFGLPMPSDSPT